MLSAIVLTLLHIAYFTYAQSTVEVSTRLGNINGIIVQKGDKTVNQFLNVPYAQPPVGHLRFKKPLPVKSWNNVFEAQSYGPSCMQVRPGFVKISIIPNTNMSEDCLSLNIYVPNAVSPAHNKSVMVFVHGGGFMTGEAQMYDGSNLALIGDVIVVTINYRLGVFGFLSTGDQEAEGNYGLWDQLMAFRWVKENINVFGGDPNSITIFGESAGAFSVGMHLFLPASDGLFQRVIAESGTPLTPSFVETTGDTALRNVKTLANKFHCPSSNNPTSDTMACLRKAPADDLINITFSQSPMTFGPVVDGQLITDYPQRMLTDKSSKSFQLFSSRDVLFGVNSGEGALFMQSIFLQGISTDTFCHYMVPPTMNKYFKRNSRISNATCYFYKSDSLDTQSMNALNFFADIHFVVPMVNLLRMHNMTSTKSSYQYLFSHQTNIIMTQLPGWFRGANHGDELGFVFGLLYFNPKTLPGDQTLSDLMMTYWTNFAKYGDPNGTNKQGSVTTPYWPSYNINQSYMNISYSPTVGHHLYQKRVEFWLDTIPTLEKNFNTDITSVFG